MHQNLNFPGPVSHLRFLVARGDLYLAVALDNGVRVLTEDGAELRRLAGTDSIRTLTRWRTPDPDHDLLLTGNGTGTLRAYDVLTGVVAFQHPLPGGEVKDVAIVGAVGEATVVALTSAGVHLWRPGQARHRTLVEPELGNDAQAFKLAAYRHQGRQYVAAGYTDGRLVLWDISDGAGGRVVTDVHAHSAQIWTMIVIGEGDNELTVVRPAEPAWPEPLLVTGGADGRMRIWRPDGEDLTERRVLETWATVRRLSFLSSRNGTLLVSATTDGNVSSWQLDSGLQRPTAEHSRHAAEVWALTCASFDEQFVIASGAMNGNLQITRLSPALISLSTMREAYVHPGRGTVWALASGRSASGVLVASGGVTGRIAVTRCGDRFEETAMLGGHEGTVRSLAFVEHDGEEHLVSGGADHTVVDWDPRTGDRRRRLGLSHGGEVWALATFTSKGSVHVVSGGNDGTVRLLRLGSGDGPDGEEVVLADDCGQVNGVLPVTVDGEVVIVVASSHGLHLLPVSERPRKLVDSVETTAICAATDGDAERVVVASADGEVRLVDPATGERLRTYAAIPGNRRVRGLSAVTQGGETFVFGACDNGAVATWHVNGDLIGVPIQAPALIQAVEVVDVELSGVRASLRTHGTLFTVGNDGVVRGWPIRSDSPYHGGGLVERGVRPASMLVQDQPVEDDTLFRRPLIESLYDVLTSPDTDPPVVLGVHGRWGQGKSSLMRQLRAMLDPWALRPGPDSEPTHRLVSQDGTELTTRITRAWAWSRLERAGDDDRPLGYEMRPVDPAASATTVWFNPWMYEDPDQLWAGLAREISDAVTSRLPREERDRLRFDLNVRRTSPSVMRQRILRTYVPRSLVGLLVTGLVVVLAAMAVVAMGVAAAQSPGMATLVGPTVLVVLAATATIVQVTLGSVRNLRTLVYTDEAGLDQGGKDAWQRDHDPLRVSERGYLYLLQHDIAELLGLATGHGPVYIFIDDLDRCSPQVVEETIEAINLFLNRAFGRCVFVVALDPATVAAHLELGAQGVPVRAAEHDRIAFGHLEHIGWRFMEKIINLPVRIPRLADDAMESYLGQLIARPRPDDVVRPEEGVEPLAVPAGAGPGGTETAGPGPDEPDDPDLDDPEEADPSDAVEVRAKVSLLETLPEVQSALRAAVLALPGRNPRQVKAFLNLWRFYMVLDHRRNLVGRFRTGIESHSVEMARFVELLVRWPYLLDMLSDISFGADRVLSTNLERLLAVCGRDDAWADTTRQLGLQPAAADVESLRALLRRSAPRREVFAGIARRYL